MPSFLEIIKSTTSNAIGSLVKKIKQDPEFLEFVFDRTSFIEDSSISFRLYHIREDLYSQIKCKQCDSLLYVQNTFCSKKCSALFNQKQPSVIEKKSKSISANYHQKTNEEKILIKEKRKTTNIKKYGVETNLVLDSNTEKTKKTWVEKYGFDNPNKNNGIKEKISISNKKKSINALKQRKITNKQKYGEENVMYLDSFKDKIRDTNFERYGESHPMKNEEYYEHYFNTHYRKFKYKKYELPSGKIVNLLGYESFILDCLLRKFSEDDIFIGYEAYKKINSSYMEGNVTKRYIPDFYIESRNLVIEVKSSYTYFTVNKNKRISINNKGIKFIYAIYYPETKIIKLKRYE